MRIAFLGTPEIAATILKDLLKSGVPIETVITQPNKPVGRGKIEQETPVKTVAVENYLDTFQPKDKGELVRAVRTVKPDLCIVAAYGMMIPNEALSIPKFGMINFHPSLLPLLRGPSPIQMAIMCGHQKTGVTIIQISEKMDAGDILDQKRVPLSGKETTMGLSEKLALIGSEMICDLLPKIAGGKLRPTKQDEEIATYCKLIKKTDGEVFFQKYHAQNIEQAYRAFTPWPGIYTNWKGKKIELLDVTILKSTDPKQAVSLEPGEVSMFKDKIAIGTAKGTILVGALKIEGKNKVTATQFVCGYQNFIGEKLA